MKRLAAGGIVVLFWLAVWQLAATVIDNTVLLVGPIETVTALLKMLPHPEFGSAVFSTLLRIGGGFLCGLLAGMLLALAAFFVPALERLLSPLMLAVKSVPVACYVIMLLIWSGNAYTAFWVCMLVVLPLLYVNTLQGMRSADKELLEIASLFTMTRADYWKHIYFPALYPFLHGACQVACAMSWKSGIAAEVIALKTGTLGNELNRAKTLLETDRLFAVTLTVIVLSWLMEKVFLALLERIKRKLD